MTGEPLGLFRALPPRVNAVAYPITFPFCPTPQAIELVFVEALAEVEKRLREILELLDDT
jgi:hypothetical protein